MKKIGVSATIFLLALTGCGSNSSKATIDIVTYFPSMNMIKEYTDVIKKDGDLDRTEYVESVTAEHNLITMRRDDTITQTVVITDNEIHVKTYGDKNTTKVLNRHLNEGGTLWTYEEQETAETLTIGSQEIGQKTSSLEETCKLDKIIDEYTISFYEYRNYDGEHAIARIKCTTKTTVQTNIDPEYVDDVVYQNGTTETKNDISFFYMQKDLGMVAHINNDCLTSVDPHIVNDLAPESECKGEQYRYILYNSQY